MPKFVGTTLDFGAVQGHNLSDPTSLQDAATKNYVDSQDAATKNYVDHDPAVLIALWQGGFS